MNGPNGFLIASGKGVLRVLMADLNIASDCVPVDCAANAVILAAWHYVNTRQRSPYVCNITNGDLKRVTWGDAIKVFLDLHGTEVSMWPVLWHCDPIVTRSPILYGVCHLLLEALPAHLLDFLIRLSGRKPFLVNINNRLQSAQSMLRYYMLREWKFINKNIVSLYASLTPEDQGTFYFNLEDCETREYFKDGAIGGKLYLLNERLDNIASELTYLRRMYWLHNTVRAVFYGLLLWLLYTWSQPALDSLEAAMEFLASRFLRAPGVRALPEDLPIPSPMFPQVVADVGNS